MNRILPKIDLTLWDWIFIGICSIPAFYMLATPAIYIWDEAVYTIASLDMHHGSSWWVPVHGEYNTKPPLVLWLQAIALTIIPSAEWAVRLPSALAVPGILILLQLGLKRWGFNIWTRVAVMICFVGHEGFIRQHISRTGDLDAVMTLFVVAYTMVALDAFFQKRWTGKHMLFFFLSIILSFYSKSIGGWLMLGPLVIVWLLSPMRYVLFTVRFWVGALLSLGICSLYYVTRELVQPGFLELVWHSEYSRMFRNVMPWHEHGAGYYFNNFTLLKTYTPWIYILALVVVFALLFMQDRYYRDQLLRWIILAGGYMLVITIPAVKLDWYDAPAYPFFALIMGVVIGYFISMTSSRLKWILILPMILILWRKMEYTATHIYPSHPFEYEGAMLRKASLNIPSKVFMQVEVPEHQLQLDFYRKLLTNNSPEQIPVIDTTAEIAVGDHIFISQEKSLLLMQNQFALDTLKIWPGLGYEIKVLSKKDTIQ